MMKRPLLVLSFLLAPVIAGAEPAVYLQDGSVIRGKVVSLADGQYTVETSIGPIVVPQVRVIRIDYQPEVARAPAATMELRPLERLSFAGALGYHRYAGKGWRGRTSEFDSASVMIGSAFAFGTRGNAGLELAFTGGWYGGNAEDLDTGDKLELTNIFAAIGPRGRIFTSESTYFFGEVGVGFHRSEIYDAYEEASFRRTAPSGHLAAGFGLRAADSTDFVLFTRFVHAPGTLRSRWAGSIGDIDMGGYEFGAGMTFRPGSLIR